jgi:hypothetical protein
MANIPTVDFIIFLFLRCDKKDVIIAKQKGRLLWQIGLMQDKLVW